MDGAELDVFSASGHKWRSTSMRVATDVPYELLLDQPWHNPYSGQGKRVHGVVIPPLNLRGHSRQTKPDGPRVQHQGHPQPSLPSSSSGRRTSANNGPQAQPATPDRNAGGRTSGDGSDGRQGKPYGAWHVATRESGGGGGGGDDGGGDRPSSSSSSTTDEEDEGGGAVAPAPVYLPEEGVGGVGLKEDERGSREAAVVPELGMVSYTARENKEQLREHGGMRASGGVRMERMPTPPEEPTRPQRMELARVAAGAHKPSPPPQAAASDGDSRSSSSNSSSSTGMLGEASRPTTAAAAAPAVASPRALSVRLSTPAGLEASTPPPPPFGLPPLAIPPPPALPPTQQTTPRSPQSQQQQQQLPVQLHDTPRSYMPQPSARSATSDGRLGTAVSSTGAVELEVEAPPLLTPTAPPPPAAAAAAASAVRPADGIETLDEVMAPALRERIRQLLSAQDALRAHQERMRAYEEEREKVLRDRAMQAITHPAAQGGGGGPNVSLGRSTRASRLAASARNPNCRRKRSSGRDASRSPSPVTRGLVASLAAGGISAAIAASVSSRAAGGGVPSAAAAASLRAPLPSVAAPLREGAAAATATTPAKGVVDASAPAGTAPAAPAPAVPAASSRPVRLAVLQQSRSLKRVQLVTGKREREKAKLKAKDKKKKEGEKGRRGKGKGKSTTSSSRSSSSSDSSSSDGERGGSEGGDSGGSSDAEGHVGAALLRRPPPPPPASKQALRGAATAAGPFASPAAAAAAVTAAASSAAPTAAAAASAAASTGTVAAAAPPPQPPRQQDGSNPEHSLGPQASGNSLHGSSSTTGRSYGGASSRPGRSSISANVPPPQKIGLPGPHGDLSHLMLLMEKLPSRRKIKPPPPPAARPTSPHYASTVGAAVTSFADAAGRAVSPDHHRRRLAQQLQQLLQSPRSPSPNCRFAYGVGEPSIWGETVVQAALGGFPSGAAAAALVRCAELPTVCHRGTLSPVPSMLLATAEPSGLVMLAAADRRQSATALAMAAVPPPPPPLDMTGPAARGAAPPPPPPAGADQWADDGDMPLAVQVMLGFVDEYDMLSAPPSSLSYGPKVGLPEAQRSAAGGLGHPYHHHQYHDHHHRRQDQKDVDPQNLHELHELHGTQIHQQLYRHHHHHHHHRHQHRHRHHRHHHQLQQQQPEGVDADPSCWLSDGSRSNSPRYGGISSPLLYGRPRSADAECSGSGEALHPGGGGGRRGRGRADTGSGGGGADSDEEGPDPAMRALRERHRLPNEASLPARLAGAVTAAREGGGAHSFAPEQVAALAGGRMTGSLSGTGGGGGGSGVRISGSGAVAAVNMPPLRAPPPPPALSAPAMIRSGGGALLPGIGAKGLAAAHERERGLVGSGGAAGAASAADAAISPIYELYALGLLPNPSLLRASMAATKPRPAAPARRRHAAAAAAGGGGSSAFLAFGDLPPHRYPDPTAAAGFPTGMAHHPLPRHDLGPLGGPGSQAIYRRAAAGTAGSGSSFAGGGGGGLFSAPSSPMLPMPSIFVHTHPHVAPGSVLQAAEAVEAGVMAARSRMGRAGALDLQHMLGVDVPSLMLQAR